ncbi:MAG: hypothetical protein JSS07_12290 [Proteobacteria bacterium]|nr:hypothetical protein [Pseudomonadota bacterium]
MRRFTLKGLFGAAEAPVEIESSATLLRMRERLTGPPHNLAKGEATRLVEDVAIAGLTRMGRAFELIKGRHVDTVIRLRNEIDALFHDVFTTKNSGTDQAVRKALENRRPQIAKLYQELDAAMEEATKPLSKMKLGSEDDAALRKAVEDLPANKKLAEDRPIKADQRIEPGTSKSRLGRKGFEPYENGFKVKIGGGETVLKIENGKYVAEIWPGEAGKGTPRRIEEHSLSLDPYKTPYGTTSVLQRNHVVQNSLMEKLFGPFGYDKDRVPTIWMRDSRTGSPHHQVSAQQRAFKNGSGNLIDDAARRATQLKAGKPQPVPPNKLNLAELQRIGVAQMKSVGCPTKVIVDYLNAFDQVFKRDVLPKLEASLSKEDVKSLLGDWTPQRGIGGP